MEKIPPIEEFIKQYNSHGLTCNCGCEWRTLFGIREYTKLHVNAALKAANKNAKVKSSGHPHYKRMVTRYSIINAYPLENIK